MPVQPFIPPEWSWVYVLVCGQDWPAANEDLLRQAAHSWTGAHDDLVELAALAKAHAAATVTGAARGSAAGGFADYWSRYVDGGEAHFTQLAEQCKGLADFLVQDADQVEFTKLSIDIQIVILLIQLVWDFAIAPLTFGASIGEGMLAAFATRLTVRQIVVMLLRAILTAVVPDAITQVIMLADGHRAEYNVGETLQAAQMGAVAGLVGLGLGRAGKGLAGSLDARLGAVAGGFVNAGLHGAATNVITNSAVSFLDGVEGPPGHELGYAQQKSGENVLAAALNGAFTGALFHAGHLATEHPLATFHLDDGQTLWRGVQVGENRYAVFDADGKLQGTGTVASGQLLLTPKDGSPDQQVPLAQLTVTHHGVTTVVGFSGDPSPPEPAGATGTPTGGLAPDLTSSGDRLDLVKLGPNSDPTEVGPPAEGDQVQVPSERVEPARPAAAAQVPSPSRPVEPAEPVHEVVPAPQPQPTGPPPVPAPTGAPETAVSAQQAAAGEVWNREPVTISRFVTVNEQPAERRGWTLSRFTRRAAANPDEPSPPKAASSPTQTGAREADPPRMPSARAGSRLPREVLEQQADRADQLLARVTGSGGAAAGRLGPGAEGRAARVAAVELVAVPGFREVFRELYPRHYAELEASLATAADERGDQFAIWEVSGEENPHQVVPSALDPNGRLDPQWSFENWDLLSVNHLTNAHEIGAYEVDAQLDRLAQRLALSPEGIRAAGHDAPALHEAMTHLPDIVERLRSAGRAGRFELISEIDRVAGEYQLRRVLPEFLRRMEYLGRLGRVDERLLAGKVAELAAAGVLTSEAAAALVAPGGGQDRDVRVRVARLVRAAAAPPDLLDRLLAEPTAVSPVEAALSELDAAVRRADWRAAAQAMLDAPRTWDEVVARDVEHALRELISDREFDRLDRTDENVTGILRDLVEHAKRRMPPTWPLRQAMPDWFRAGRQYPRPEAMSEHEWAWRVFAGRVEGLRAFRSIDPERALRLDVAAALQPVLDVAEQDALARGALPAAVELADHLARARLRGGGEPAGELGVPEDLARRLRLDSEDVRAFLDEFHRRNSDPARQWRTGATGAQSAFFSPHSGPRIFDAETKMLVQTLQVLRNLPGRPEGVIAISPDKAMCPGCQDVLAHVQREFPDVTFVVGGKGTEPFHPYALEPDSPPVRDDQTGLTSTLDLPFEKLGVTHQSIMDILTPAAEARAAVPRPAHLTELTAESRPGHQVFLVEGDSGPSVRLHLSCDGDRAVLLAEGAEHSPMAERAAGVRAPEGMFAVVGHATRHGFVVGAHTVALADVFDKIPLPRDTVGIQLLACDAGAGDAAQALADQLRLPVVASDRAVWLTADHKVIAAGDTNPGDPYPRIPPDGTWHLYLPGAAAEQAPELVPGDPRLPATPAELLAPHGWVHAGQSGQDGHAGDLEFPVRGTPDPLLVPERANELFRALHERCRQIAVHQQEVADDLLRQGRGEYWFARVYQQVTEFELKMINSGEYTYPIMKLQEVEAFHEAYARNLTAWLDGRPDLVEPTWRLAFEAAARFQPHARVLTLHSVEVLDTLLPSFEAHIRFDLPRAIAAVHLAHYAGSGVDLSAFRADYDRMQPVFDQAQAAVRPAIADYARGLDPGKYGPAQAIGMPVVFNVPRERAHAFERALDLVRLSERDLDGPQLQRMLELLAQARHPFTWSTDFKIGTYGRMLGEKVTDFAWRDQPVPPGGFVKLGTEPVARLDPRRTAFGFELAGAELLRPDLPAARAAVQAVLRAPVLPAGAVADPHRLAVTWPVGGRQVEVTFELRPVAEDSVMALGERRYAPVTTTTDDPTLVPGAVRAAFRVEVCANARAEHVRQAVAATIAEIDARLGGSGAGAPYQRTSALVEGARHNPDGSLRFELSTQDIGRLGAMRMLAYDLAQAHDHPVVAAGLRLEAAKMLVQFGLAERFPAVEPHWLDQNTTAIGPTASALRLLEVEHSHPDTYAAIKSLVDIMDPANANLIDAIHRLRADEREGLRVAALDLVDRHEGLDLAMTQEVTRQLRLSPTHVFGRLILGNGWAAVADHLTLGAPGYWGIGMPETMLIGREAEPWLPRGQLRLGQVAAEVEIPGLPVQPSMLTDHPNDFAQARDFATAVGASAAVVGVPTLHGEALLVEPRPAGAGPDWPPDARYRVRVTVDGETYHLFARDVDIATGPGAARVPAAIAGPGSTDPPAPFADRSGLLTSGYRYDVAGKYYVDTVNHRIVDPTGHEVALSDIADPATRARLSPRPGADWPGNVRVQFGGDEPPSPYLAGERILVYGAGASAAWDVERAFAAAGTTIDWRTRSLDPIALLDRATAPGAIEARYPYEEVRADVLDLIKLAQQRRTAPLPADQEQQYQKLLGDLSFVGGHNRRNSGAGSAFSPEVWGSTRISRAVGEIVTIVSTLDGRVQVTFSDGSAAVYDRVVVSVGQDPAAPGGARALVEPFKGSLVPIEGTGAEFEGLQDPGGHLRVLGAPAVAPEMAAVMAPGLDPGWRARLENESYRLSYDSYGIAASIAFHGPRIARANHRLRTGGPPVAGPP